MAINGAKNAGIYAAQIIGATCEEMRSKVEKYKSDLTNEVEAKAVRLEQEGFEKYLSK